jgi:hypothetical protein
MSRDTRTHRTWCYTINNFSNEDIEQLKSFECTKHRCAKELGDSGTPHLQGVIAFKTSYRLSQLKKLIPKAHWEPTKSLDHSVNYCTKGEIIVDLNSKELKSRLSTASSFVKEYEIKKKKELIEAQAVEKLMQDREMLNAFYETFGMNEGYKILKQSVTK